MARVTVTRTMTRKDGKAKATVKKDVTVKTNGPKTTVRATKKIVPNVKAVKGN